MSSSGGGSSGAAGKYEVGPSQLGVTGLSLRERANKAQGEEIIAEKLRSPTPPASDRAFVSMCGLCGWCL